MRATGGLQRDGADAGEGSGWQDPTLRVAMSTEVVGLCVLPDTRESDWLFQAFGAPPALPALYGVAPPGRLVGFAQRSGPPAVCPACTRPCCCPGLGDADAQTVLSVRAVQAGSGCEG